MRLRRLRSLYQLTRLLRRCTELENFILLYRGIVDFEGMVDDGSTDSTSEVASRYDEIHLITRRTGGMRMNINGRF